MKNVGVIGLGIIGEIWAKHYANAGVLAGTWNRTARPDHPRWQPDLPALAKAADVLHIVVADPPAVRSILERIAPQLGKGKVVVQSSTIDPSSSEEFRQFVTAKGAAYLEAPFTGSKPAAEERKTVFYLGGEAALMDDLEPLLALISEVRLRIGTNKQAASLKLAMNLNIAAQVQGLVEALTLVRKAGMSDDVFFAALGRNVGYSGVTRLKEPKLRANDFSPQFSVKHLLKDLKLAGLSEGARDFPLRQTLQDCYAGALDAGLGDLDVCAVIQKLPS